MKDFGEIWDKTWTEYKTKIKSFVKLFTVYFLLIPFIFMLIATAVYVLSTLTGFLPLLALIPVLILVAIGIMLLGYVNYTYLALQKTGKHSIKEIYNQSKPRYWSYFRLFIVMILFAAAFLFIPILIPAIPFFTGMSLIWILPLSLISIAMILIFISFALYWSFASFIVVEEKIKVILALKKSFKIVKGKWWLVFGYGLLIGLILSIISSILGLPQLAGSIIRIFSPEIGWTIYTIGTIIRIIAQALIMPFGLLFFKNFYLEMKNRK
jgi:hypothetical protein